MKGSYTEHIHSSHFYATSSQLGCSANYLFCSCQEPKIVHNAGTLKKYEEHLIGGIFYSFNGFFQNLSYRTHENFARKPNFLAEPIQILPRGLEMRK